MTKKAISPGAVHNVPPDLRKVLISDPVARAKWEDITPLARNEWICWVISANVLFHVVNDRHLRKRPMIFTTNKPLNQWGKVLHDEDMAAAILDRVLERGRFIYLDGPSGRTRHLNLEEILPASTDRARISGTHRVPSLI